MQAQKTRRIENFWLCWQAHHGTCQENFLASCLAIALFRAYLVVNRYLAGQLGRFASSFTGAHVSDFLSKIDEPGKWTRNIVRQIPRAHR
jgi:hypothetical protein